MPLTTTTSGLTGAQALFVAGHALSVQTWVNRRVERIEYLDERSTRHRVSIDLTIPAGWPHGDAGAALMPLPIAQFVKRSLTAFDFVDEDGRSIPMLTAQQNGAISSELLQAVAAVPRPELIDQIVERYIPALVFSSNESQRRFALRMLFQPGTEVGRVLWSFPPFQALALELGANFIVYLPVDPKDAGRRRVVKLAFDHGDLSHGPRRLPEWLGFSAVRHSFDIPAAGFASSYHVEVQPPPDMRIEQGVFAARRNRAAVADRSRPSTGAVHLNLTDLDRAPGLVRLAIVARSTVLTGAALFSGVAFVTLLFVRLRLHNFAKEQSFDAVVAAVLTLPGIALAYASRPSEHPVASVFLVGLRALVVGGVLASFAAAIVLFAGYSERDLVRIYTVLTVVSGVCAAGLVSSLFAHATSMRPEIDL
jgi:hypothetical protein